MSQDNKTCGYCTLKGHSRYYCPTHPKTAIKTKEPAKRVVLPAKSTKGKATVSIAKKPKTKSRSKLVKELDDVFSKYIRQLYAVDGYTACVTCPANKPWQEMQNGHYMSRGDLPTRWDETNCHPQCVACNVFKKGNYTEYAIYMIDRYGVGKLAQLKLNAKSGEKIPTSVIKDKIEEYKHKLDQIA